MDLYELRIFSRVAELASFTRAAEELGLAKGRVSTLVQALEAEVGGRLLQRTTRSVRLTPDGEAFLARCKELLTEADQLQGMFRPAHLRLQCLHQGRDPALGHAQLLGRPGEAGQFGDAAKYPQLIQVHAIVLSDETVHSFYNALSPIIRTVK